MLNFRLDEEGAGDEEEEIGDDEEASLADDLLDEVSEGDVVEDEVEGFGLLEEATDDDEEEDEEEAESDDTLEEDAEDVDFDTFDDIDEM